MSMRVKENDSAVSAGLNSWYFDILLIQNPDHGRPPQPVLQYDEKSQRACHISIDMHC